MRVLLLPSAMHVCRELLKAATDRQHEHEKLKANAVAKRPMASCVRVRKTRWCSGAATASMGTAGDDLYRVL